MKECVNCKKYVNRLISNKCSACYQKEKVKENIKLKKYTRFCPLCNEEMIYTNKYNLKVGIDKNTNCKSCDGKIKIQKYREEHKGFKGENNPFYGKNHSEEFINLMQKPKTEDHKLNLKISIKQGFDNGRQIWNKGTIGLYTPSEETKIKISLANTGENNSMYGKPSPIGSGNGWSGWYKNIYFRSLLELSYLYFLIQNNIKFENAEQKKYAIQYRDSSTGSKRNYFADFYLLNSQELIEIKPKKLLNTIQNKDKYKAAKEKHGDKFIVITEENINKLKKEEIKKLYDNKELIWLKRYEEKFLNFNNKENNCENNNS